MDGFNLSNLFGSFDISTILNSFSFASLFEQLTEIFNRIIDAFWDIF